MKASWFTLLVLLFILACANDPQDISPEFADAPTEEANLGCNSCLIHFETQAYYPDGMLAWNNYLKEHMHYPPAEQASFEGAVYLSFLVEQDGTLSDIQVIRGIHESIDKEAIRLLTNSKPWAPAQLYGEDIKSKIQIRIIFRSDRS